MPYIIGFGPSDMTRKLSVVGTLTAKSALELVRRLQRSDEETKFILGPGGWQISQEELEIDAKGENVNS
jgi:hypothetical protein